MKYVIGFMAMAFVMFCIPISPAFSQNRPNILILIADDMGTDAMGVYGIGTDQPNTPNLDGMLDDGLLFTNAWAYPTCAPSRASLLTGRYGNKNGVIRSGPNLPNEEVTIFEHLKAITNNGYAAAAFGKWHLGNANHPNNNGLDYFAGSLFSGVDDYYHWERVVNGVTDTSQTYVTSYITDEAINWIDNHTEPWIVWMAYNAPHGPIHLPPDSLYTRIDTASNFDKYICMIESVDHESGRLYNSLTQAEKDSTIIIFVGDNGTPNGQLQTFPNGHGKSTLYEGGINIPMFITGYGVGRENEIDDALVSFSDVFATITELLGFDLPGGIDNSFSFHQLLSDATAPTRTYNYSEFGDLETDRAIRNAQYKLITRFDGTQEFFDLLADPYEENDLIMGNPDMAMQQIIDELQSESDSIFLSWSCNDDILNGEEEDIDCGGNSCAPCLTVSIEEPLINDAEILVYPNPASSLLNIDSGADILKSIRCFDYSGRQIYAQQHLSTTKTNIDLSNLPAGIYILEVVVDDKAYLQTFVKVDE
ncbi:MAG: sulfatase-like hydrolase/transferase [Bacteroidota bacterium]